MVLAPRVRGHSHQIELGLENPFWVVFSGSDGASKEVDNWCERQQLTPLHVTRDGVGRSIRAESVDFQFLRRYFENILVAARKQSPRLDIRLCEEALGKWVESPRGEAGLAALGHNVFTPNRMALEGAGIIFEKKTPNFIGQSEAEYHDAIRTSAEAVLRLREQVGSVPAFLLNPPQPDMILAVPALYHHAYNKLRRSKETPDIEDRVARDVLRYIRGQKGFRTEMEGSKLVKLLRSETGRNIFGLRSRELSLQTAAIGLRGATTLTATVRLPPGLNQIKKSLQQLSDHARGPHGRRKKFPRLFKAVQEELSRTVGEDLLELISRSRSGLKVIADVPLEWVPIQGIPLGIKFNCSRVPATPGNLLMGLLAKPRTLTLLPEAFHDILVVSAFDSKDPIREILPGALDLMDHLWREKLNVRFVEVETIAGFKHALNTYTGPLLIFDGHGTHESVTDTGMLSIGAERVDIWSLRGKVRIPPAVILSACDTHATDRSHATTGSGFLAIGARTVLATLLPINAVNAAAFIARLIYRLAEFVPAVIEGYAHALSWSEVIGGMLRMQLTTELLMPLHLMGVIDQPKYELLHTHANNAINSGADNWFEGLVDDLSEHVPWSKEETVARLQSLIVVSDAVRYIQMGNPESFLIASQSVARALRSQVAEL